MKNLFIYIVFAGLVIGCSDKNITNDNVPPTDFIIFDSQPILKLNGQNTNTVKVKLLELLARSPLSKAELYKKLDDQLLINCNDKCVITKKGM